MAEILRGSSQAGNPEIGGHEGKLGCPEFSGLLILRLLCCELLNPVLGADFVRCPVAEC